MSAPQSHRVRPALVRRTRRSRSRWCPHCDKRVCQQRTSDRLLRHYLAGRVCEGSGTTLAYARRARQLAEWARRGYLPAPAPRTVSA